MESMASVICSPLFILFVPLRPVYFFTTISGYDNAKSKNQFGSQKAV